MKEMEVKHEKPRYSAITLGIVLLTAFVLVQPTMNTYAQVGAEGAPNYFACGLLPSDQLSDPFEMDTVRSGKIAKTIIAEKEIFRCLTEQGNIDLLVDVTVVAEILEDMNTKTIISKQAHVIACAKLAPANQGSTIITTTYVTTETTYITTTYTTTVTTTTTKSANGDATLLGCDVYVPKTDFVPVSGCESFGLHDEMQEMNTINKRNIVKTIIAQKELLYCTFGTPPNSPADIDDKKVEQYTIEEIWEDLDLAPADTVVKQTVESLRCWTLVTEAFVESCQFATVPVQPYDDED